ncbi:MAG: nuclear transport factor 2 family protein [Emcibacter sp.]|nr:nuclear transport factor 2 family protein [Emcibacter sp.]
MKWIICLISFIFIMGEAPAMASDDKAEINALMDGFHDAAAKADEKRYLGYFTKDGVFMGTDDWERWPLNPDFRAYVAERFKEGTGWAYKAIERNVAFSPDNNVAWFDEITESEKWGLFRGTGVLLKQGEGWKIAHYSMSVLVPNEAWVAVSDLNKAAVKKRDADKK